MRMLFTFAGGRGHLEPLVPIARAAQGAGHTVAVAGQALLLEAVRAFGFAALTAGARVGRLNKSPLLPPEPEREELALARSYAGWIARGRAADLLAVCAEWRPDLLVCDEFDFGAMIVAERLGLPHATVLVSAAGSFVRKEVIADPLNMLRADHGLPPDDAVAMTARHLVLSPFPPRFRDPAAPGGENLRWTPADAAAAEVSEFTKKRPLLYVTLGTVFNLESGDLFQRVLAGLRALPANALVTVGEQLSPAELAEQPAHIRIAGFIPQGKILPQCSAVLSHGGSGTVMGALAHGLPQVLIPMGADQPHNAARCVALGLGLVLDPIVATPEMVRAAVATVLSDPAYRLAAGRMRDDIAALPPPSHAVALLERLSAGRTTSC